MRLADPLSTSCRAPRTDRNHRFDSTNVRSRVLLTRHSANLDELTDTNEPNSLRIRIEDIIQHQFESTLYRDMEKFKFSVQK